MVGTGGVVALLRSCRSVAVIDDDDDDDAVGDDPTGGAIDSLTVILGISIVTAGFIIALPVAVGCTVSMGLSTATLVVVAVIVEAAAFWVCRSRELR